MITLTQIAELDDSFSELTAARKRHEAEQKQFKEKQEKIRDSIRHGETTGDQILDWALCREYPYQEREKRARAVQSYLLGQVGDYFFFLDNQQSYQMQTSWKFHGGKIAAPALSFNAVGMRLSLVIEEGTMVEKEIISYGNQSATVHGLLGEKRSQPFIDGLLDEPYHQKEGILESAHATFSEDDYHYILGAGQNTILSALCKRKMIPRATKECLDALLLK